MKEIIPGHLFELDVLDGHIPISLTFVSRIGTNYPGNLYKFSGTTTQEVLRALINRSLYVDRQKPDFRNKLVTIFLRLSLYLLEQRAAKLHKRRLISSPFRIEEVPKCPKCGHIDHVCKESM